jgi:hypothetical protein
LVLASIDGKEEFMLSEAGKEIVQRVWPVSGIVLVVLSHGGCEALFVQKHIGKHVARLKMVIFAPKIVPDTLVE